MYFTSIPPDDKFSSKTHSIIYFSISPEELFCQLTASGIAIGQLQDLAIITGLDLSQLSLKMAERKLYEKDMSYAKQLLALAKVIYKLSSSLMYTI
jgi:hypothetical protein